MEGTYEETVGATFNNAYGTTDFGMIDFMDEANLDQFIDLIRGGESPAVNFSPQGYNFDQHNNIGVGCLADMQLFSPVPPVDLFNFNIATSHDNANVNMTFGVPDHQLLNEVEEKEQVEETMDGDESSATTTDTTNMPRKTKNGKSDRSKTLTSERKRRGRMKEKLYALRSLVPNITKMDKASIVGDAVLYVQDLQMQAKKLKAEISGLESSLTGEHTSRNSKKSNITSFSPIFRKIFKMDVIQVAERDFYVRIASNKGKGVAVSLYKAIESLTSFKIRSSNLADSAGNFVFTFTFCVTECETDISVPILKQWVANALLNQGFNFETSLSL